MEQIRKIDVFDGRETRRIGLYSGDLAEIPPEHAVDILIVSAFPNDYIPTRTSLVGALARSGLSIAELARHKAHDLRQTNGFWLSQLLGADHAPLNVGRILCFEPALLGHPPEVVGSLFRGMYPFLDDDNDANVAMALIAAGNQGWSASEMFTPLLEAAVEWLRRGLPIKELKIVERSPDVLSQLKLEFDRFERHIRPSTTQFRSSEQSSGEPSDILSPHAGLGGDATDDDLQVFQPMDHPGYDVFISYASEDSTAAEKLSYALKTHRPDVKIFDFRSSIDKGHSWQQAIDDAITNCQRVIAVLSPDYFASPECTEEIMMARLRNKRSGGKVLHPVYWRDIDKELALWLQIINYSDCREADELKIAVTAGDVAGKL